MRKTSLIRRMVWLAAVLALGGLTTSTRAADEAKPAKKPKIEVVFCLDTTGSMGGLIEGAKQKIWAISNQIAGGKPTPELKVGLVAYRDRGDAYITKVYRPDRRPGRHSRQSEGVPGPGRRRRPRERQPGPR